MTLASRIAIMKDGLVQQFATPAEIYDRPTNMYVAGFIGAPAMNFVRGQIARENGELGISALVKAHGGQGPRFLPLAQTQPHFGGWVGRDVVLGVRPEAISVATSPERAPATAQVDAEIDVIEPTGADTLAYFTMGGATTVARVRPQDIAGAGGTMRFALDMSRTSLFDPKTEARLN
jgi:multiple sugar transport system ATP-binding protein